VKKKNKNNNTDNKNDNDHSNKNTIINEYERKKERRERGRERRKDVGDDEVIMKMLMIIPRSTTISKKDIMKRTRTMTTTIFLQKNKKN